MQRMISDNGAIMFGLRKHCREIIVVVLAVACGFQLSHGSPKKEGIRVSRTISLNNPALVSRPAPLDSIPVLRHLADGMIQGKKLDEALRLYRRIVLSVPHDLGAAITLADLYAWTGDYDRAVALFRDIIEQDTLNLAGVKGLARVMRWATRYSEAELYYAAILRKEPDDIDALTGLAITYAQQRNLEVALNYINHAIEKSPENSELIRIRGDILAWGNHFRAAEENYLAALRIDPGSADVYRSLGDLYRWAGKHASAIEALKKARLIEPKNPEVLITLSNVFLDAGMIRQSEEALKDLFAVDPNNSHGFEILRRLELRNVVDYGALMNGYAKPAFLVVSNLFIGLYFWKRRERLMMRSHRLMKYVYRIWPWFAGLWVLLFVVAKTTGFWGTDIMTEIAEFATLAVWMVAFVTLVWVTRTQQRLNDKVVLAIGAHPDDIELGCGGTLSRYKEMGYRVFGLVITSGEAGNPYTNEKIDRRKEAEEGASILGLDGIWVYRFKDCQLHSQINEIKDVIEEKIRETGADIIITQSPHDIHQDHKAVFEATKIAARGDKTLLCYEDVSTESHFAANYFVDITDYLDDKINAIRAHRTQKAKAYMDSENISGRAAHRGLQTGVRYAEAFLLYKGVDLWTSS